MKNEVCNTPWVVTTWAFEKLMIKVIYLNNLKIRMLKKLIIKPQNKGRWVCLAEY